MGMTRKLVPTISSSAVGPLSALLPLLTRSHQAAQSAYKLLKEMDGIPRPERTEQKYVFSSVVIKENINI